MRLMLVLALLLLAGEAGAETVRVPPCEMTPNTKGKCWIEKEPVLSAAGAGEPRMTESTTCYAKEEGKAYCGETVCSINGKRVPCLDPDVPTPVKPCCVPDCLAQMEAAR